MSMTYDELTAELQKKIYKPVYLLTGDESYYIDKITEIIEENILTEAESSFNMTVMYGKDTDVASIDLAARRFPMMANYQVVLVKEAHEIKNIEKLAHYIENPLKSTILVLVFKYKPFDKRKSLYKLIEKKGVVFESKKIYDDKIPDWIIKYLEAKGLTIKQEAAFMMAEFLGTELSVVSNELNKLAILFPAGTLITSEHIEKNIGISKDYNSFELQKALGQRDVLKVNRIVNYFGHNSKNNPMVIVVGNLFTYFSKILKLYGLNSHSSSEIATALEVNPYFLKDYTNAKAKYPLSKVVKIIALLREYDLKSKGVDSKDTSDYQLLKELVFKILHV